MTVAYVDSSAVVKLIVTEAQSSALATALNAFDDHLTSEVAVIEVTRAVRRTGQSAAAGRVDDVLSRIGLVAVDHDVVQVARFVEPTALRTLDTIHLATAVSLGLPDLTFVAYDQRLLGAAEAAGLAVAAPR